MVKIKLKSLLISFVIFIFLMSVAHAVGSKLLFSDIDVKVGGKSDKNVKDGDRIDRDAEPGDTIEFRVEVKNNFTSAENLKIENVEVEVTIEEIDDGDDFEESSKDFDLRHGRDKRSTLKFEIPLEVEEDDFQVIIRVDGEDENGTDHEREITLTLEVDKESHLLSLTRSSLSPNTVSCSRRNVQLSVGLLNIGNEDEDDVNLHIFNTELAVDIREDLQEITAEPFEDESKFSKIYSFNVPSTIEAGSYPVTVRALYDNNRRKVENTVTLTVNACGTTDTKQGGTTDSKGDNSVVVVTPPPKTTPEVPTIVIQPPLPPGTTVTQEGFFKGNAFVISIIAIEIIAVIAGIILLVTLFARRD
ncbi:hypothetical protein CMO83_04675 [Candidatus Woesearchaeota archaeon]|nr:hypothetical protein [Candidatus Woesearchaeota archaeon]